MKPVPAAAPVRLTLRRPDDWHLHLRDGAILRAVLPLTAAVFGRAVVMPNLKLPVTHTAHARAYRDEIMKALPAGMQFQPLMTAYLTDATDAKDLEQGFHDGVLTAAKLYPANATTHAELGVTDIRQIYPVLERMQAMGMPLLLHGEVTETDVDIFDREKIFIDRILTPLLAAFPALKIVFEHITTSDAVDFVKAQADDGRLGATITAHHLFLNRSDIFRGGLRPHHYCLPVAKREQHRLALIDAATAGHAAFFLGTDSAPHPVAAKESACGCAGIFTAATALELYAEIFDAAGALDQLEAFASLNGPRFYGLPANTDSIVLEQGESAEPAPVRTEADDTVLPFTPPDGTLHWRARPQRASGARQPRE